MSIFTFNPRAPPRLVDWHSKEIPKNPQWSFPITVPDYFIPDIVVEEFPELDALNPEITADKSSKNMATSNSSEAFIAIIMKTKDDRMDIEAPVTTKMNIEVPIANGLNIEVPVTNRLNNEVPIPKIPVKTTKRSKKSYYIYISDYSNDSNNSDDSDDLFEPKRPRSTKVCRHNVSVRTCRICSDTFCSHQKQWWHCDICKITICRHNKSISRCKTCQRDIWMARNARF